MMNQPSSLPRGDHCTLMPLGRAQAALWTLYREAPQSPAYNMALALRLSDTPSRDVLGTVIHGLSARHGMLRARFTEIDGLPRQWIARDAAPALRCRSAAGWDESRLLEALHAAVRVPFNLEDGALRAELFEDAPGGAVLLLVLHHIIGDATSLAVLGRELVAGCAAALSGAAASAEPSAPAADYADYLRWQAATLDGPAGERLGAYWRERLAGEPLVLDLPTDHPRPARRAMDGGSCPFALPQALAEALRAQAVRAGTTLPALFCCAYAVLLHRLSGQDRVRIGIPTAMARTRPEYADLVGYLVDLMVLESRLDATGATPFDRLLAATTAQLFAGLRHQPYPFALLCEQLVPQRDPGVPPLVQTLFSFEDERLLPRRFDAGAVQAERLELCQMEGQLDLTLTVIDDGGLGGRFSYDTALFEAATVERLAHTFVRLLEGIVAAPDAAVQRLGLLTAAEQAQLAAWNATDTEYPADQTVVDLFEAQASATPEHIALVFAGEELTYAALDARANQLAHALIERGVGPDVLVALCAERSFELVVGLLAILKAGGAYVPLDPEYPEERLAFMLEDCAAAVLLTTTALQDRLAAPQAQVLLLDGPAPHGPPSAPPARRAGPDDLAYCIYTSGSTGRPKGVLCRHAGLTNLALAQIRAFAIDADSRVLQFASPSFDAAVSEIATALLAGAALVLVGRDQLLTGDLPRRLAADGVTHVTLPPSFLAGIDGRLPPTLRTLVVAGEACPPGLVRRHAGDRRFINAYGPTEATVCASLAVLTPSAPTPVIGRPLDNCRIQILDAGLAPVPVGVVGELCIAGSGLARGYLNRPELTAERFVEIELFGRTERLYRSGDRARWRADGNLEYLGRLDAQVKLRGFRIELGEIEAGLCEHPAVAAAAVVVHEADGTRALAAYLVAKPDADTAAPEPRAWLAARLPGHMLPATVTWLDRLPLNANGKLDRAALPAPRVAAEAGFAAPRNAVERRLAAAWSAVLGRTDIGIHDNFYALGGDSILGIQIVARARDAGLGLAPRDLSEHQTIAALAAAARPLAALQAEQGPVRGKLTPTPILDWFLARPHPAPHHFNQARLLHVPNDLNETALAAAFAAVLRHHDALRLRLDPAGPVLTHAEPQADALPLHRVDLPASQDLAAGLAEQAASWQAGLDLVRGPLTRLVRFRHPQGERLLWIVHHLAVDGVSWPILIADLALAYTQSVVGEPIALPPKTTSFKAWSERLRQWADGPALAAQADWWRAQHDGAAPGLPLDDPAAANRTADLRQVRLALDDEQTSELLEAPPAAFRAGVEDLLLAALLLALAEHTGARRHLIELERHGRAGLFDDLDLSRTVGWFTAVAGVGLTLPDDDAPGAVIRALKEQLRAIPDGGIGCGLLRQRGAPLPRGAVLFNYQGRFDRDGADGFMPADEDSGPAFAGGGAREHAIEINGAIAGGRLRMDLAYSAAQLRDETATALVAGWRRHLLRLIAHCREHRASTPSDFPLAGLSQARIDALEAVHGPLDAVHPLTPMQQGILFHSLEDPTGGAYVEQMQIALAGELRPDLLRAAWERLVARHPVLRSCFSHDGDEPLQLVLPTVALPWTEHDWRALSTEQRAERLAALLAEGRRRGFDATRHPLLRLDLIREDATRWRLLLQNHHVLLDGWSNPVLLRELRTLYAALLSGSEPALAPTPPFERYIAWLLGRDRTAARAHWRAVLEGLESPTPIPIEQRSRDGGAPRRAVADLRLDAAATAALEQFARRHRTTLSILMQAAWALLLGRYADRRDVVFGITVAGRTAPLDGIEDLVGCCINTLPVRARLDRDLPALLADLAQARDGAEAHGHASLAEIQRDAGLPGGTALFDSILVFENYPPSGDDDGPLRIDGIEVSEQTNYLLTLAVLPGERLLLRLGFDAARILPAAAERLLGHLRTLLEAMPSRPETPPLELPLLGADEVRRLAACNATDSEYDRSATLTGLFRRQALATPHAVALRCAGTELTYAELDARAAALAQTLIGLGVGPGVLVGVCLPRTEALAATLLGILEAGGAYVPLDPAYPAERLRIMLEDSAAAVLVTTEALRERLPAGTARVVPVDALSARQAPPPAERPERAGAGDLAYILFTSGSTGRPKGVAIRHRSAVALLHWAHREFSAADLAGTLAATSINFDLSVFELFAPLTAGGSVILADDALGLVDTPHRDAVTLINTVPSAMTELLRLGAVPAGVRAVNLAGEPLRRALVDAVYGTGSVQAVRNLYGPSEDTTYSTGVLVPRDEQGEPTIGRPLPNTRVYLLDAEQRPVPLGLPGELCIAGDGLAQGYLGRAELTAERFVEAAPFGQPERLYRTGDLARWRDDGELVYLGRVDHQIKLRGFRIELGEIESVLRRHEAIADAAVAVQANGDDPQLAAYLVFAEAPPADPASVLRPWLAARLPAFMLPGSWTLLEALPLTPNGKLDRAALPAPERAPSEAGRAPETPTERRLADLWGELLGRDATSAEADFFDLGGHSLLATRLVARISDAFGIDLPLKVVFTHARLADLAGWLDAQGETATSAAIAAQPPEVPRVLSFAQQRLWFLARLEGPSATYNMPLTMDLTGPLQPDVLGRALKRLIARQQGLRLVFPARDGAPTLAECANEQPLTVIDLRGLAERERAAETARRERALAETPFDLAVGPLLRAELLVLDDARHRLTVCLHHAIADGWSMDLFFGELAELYRADAERRGADLPALGVCYSDYAAWQRERLGGAELARQLDDGCRRLDGAPRTLDLPTDRPRPPRQSFRGARHASRLDARLTAGLKALAASEGATLFMTLLAAFAVLLARHSGQRDLLIGTPVANRSRPEVEHLIGLFVNTLVLRLRPERGRAFNDLLGRLRGDALDAHALGELPFEQLVDALGIERDLSRSPLIQVMFVLQERSAPAFTLPGITAEPREPDLPIAKLDLSLSAAETEAGIALGWEYAADLFDAARIRRMAAGFETLLAAIVADPAADCARLPIIAPAEQAQLAHFNATSIDFEAHPTPDPNPAHSNVKLQTSNFKLQKTVLALFEAQARSAPANPALLDAAGALDYGALNRRANRLAHALIDQGVGVGDRVALLLPRSAGLVAAQIAVLKAGAAFVPLDPEQPRERLALMLEDCAARALIGSGDALPAIDLPRLAPDAGDGLPETDPPLRAGPEDPAYCIFTSGSTGRPKAVVVGHRALANLVHWHRRAFAIRPSDRATLVANPAFDANLWETWPYLAAGAALCPLGIDQITSPRRLAEAMDALGITLSFLPTPLLELALAERTRWPESLRLLLTGGDRLGRHPGAGLGPRIINNYGPTEAAVVATSTELSADGIGTPPIGRPIANTRVHLLDDADQPVPIGVPGELCIAGDGLALGYLNRPGLTAERFVTLELAGATERVYRTGDLARWRNDGQLEFLGRRDHQVKLRGLRVELGEIEAVLAAHPAVAAAAVALHQTDAGALLAAWVVPSAAGSGQLGAEPAPVLRPWLAERLPESLLPAVFGLIDALPLTANGKLDRAALPAPEPAQTTSGRPARGPIEELLATLWCALLGRDAVAADASFFALGGHSLLAARLAARIHDAFGVELALTDLFAHPVLADQAALIERGHRGAGLAPIPLLAPDAPLLPSPAQRRLWFLAHLESTGDAARNEGAAYNVPTALRLRGRLDLVALRRALTELIDRHEALRHAFPGRDGEPALHILPAYDPLQIDDLRELSESARALAVEQALDDLVATRFDLATGPLFAVRLLRLADDEHLLLQNLHHIVADGWSAGVLLGEWSLLYNAHVTGSEPSLPPLPIRCTDYAAWQRDWLAGDGPADQLAYWQAQLADAPELLELPTDRPRPAVRRFAGAHRRTELDPALSATVQAFCRRSGVTLFMGLFAAFNVLLHRWSGQTDLLVGTPVANRGRRETEDLVGLLVNTLVLRTRLSAGLTVAALLDQVRRTALAAYAHQELPFEQVVEHLAPPRRLSHSPLFQVMFVLQNAPHGALALDGLEAEPVALRHRTAKFDLTLGMAEEAGRLVCDWEYNTDLFDAETIERMDGHLRVLLAAMAAAPDTPIAHLPLLSAAERQALLDWNAKPAPETGSGRVAGAGLIGCFEAQVAARPEAVALIAGDERQSYDALNRRANRIAHWLMDAGVGPETLVGLCLPRSADLVAALLGILKAGGAYLPLDRAQPAERLGFMLEDSATRIIVTCEDMGAGLDAADRTVLRLDRDADALARQPETNPPARAGADHLAYVIYTSGSTGRPKGCMVTRANVARLFDSTDAWFGFGPDDCWTLFHSYAFDFTVWELWGALLYGGRLVVVPEALRRSPADFHRLLIREQVTVLNQTPSAFRQLIAVDDRPDALALRYVIFGGEALDFAALAPWFARHGDERPQLINMYGITETTVHVTYQPLRAAMAAGRSLIGRPLPDLSAWLLDANGEPVPPGLPGELFIGGAGVCRGYLNRPELTAERFVERSVLGVDGRLYRTGDQARLLADGTLEYLGRIDHQVQLRGFRIELGEIETWLTQHPAVRDAVVMLDGTGDAARLIAWVTLTGPAADPAALLRAWLAPKLPDYMIPAGFVVLDAMPLTGNGKLDRRALPRPTAERLAAGAGTLAPEAPLEREIAAVWQDLLGLDRVGVEDNFFDIGGHSLLLLKVQQRLAERLGRALPVVTLFQYPTVRALAAHLSAAAVASTDAQPQVRPVAAAGRDIAIIGLAGRFPGAADIDAFWANLRAGVESVRALSDAECLAAGVPAELLAHPDYVKAGAVLEDADRFDAGFFGYAPAEAARLDPQLRLFLETAWAALEHAGYDPDRLDAPVGLYAGSGAGTYLINNLLPHGAAGDSAGNLALQLGDGSFSVAAAAYKLNLRGPALSLYTACSTALVATHMACRSLLDGECAMAMAGGVAVPVPQTRGYLYQQDMIVSPDGHCRAFDAEARGTVGGAGAGLVVLKRLADAERDGDTIHAVIKGSAVNNDGTDKVGFTAPSVHGQARVIEAAMAGLDYDSVGYVETHGAGTALGDPIEVAALTRAYRGHTERRGDCAIGSVKTNIGHLDTAAGIAGLIKTVLALKARELPPSLHFNRPNPAIDFAASPFYVNRRLKPWPGAAPRRAGVSSFGIGGTNAHLVLEEAPQGPAPADDGAPRLLLLSARSETALTALRERLAEHLEGAGAGQPIADIAYTLAAGRRQHGHRGFLIATERAETAARLRAGSPAQWRSGAAAEDAPPLVFLFPGQGAQHAGMGRGLYTAFPVFRQAVDDCAERLIPALGLDLRRLLYPADGETPDLTTADVAQPALFVTGYALARQCEAWGLRPAAMLGHSIGEYVAACLASVFDLDEALDLVAARGRLMRRLPPGEMLSVLRPPEVIAPLLGDGAHLAAVNAPGLCAVSGTAEAIGALAERLRAERILHSRVPHANAAHSPLMAPIVAALRERLGQIALRAPSRPFISNLTGTWISAEQARSPDYWCEHLMQPVRFCDGLDTLLGELNPVLLELGPDMTLTSFALQHGPARRVAAFNLMPTALASVDERAHLLDVLGRLWLRGVSIDWDALYRGEGRRRVPLPTYPFERRRHWIDPPAAGRSTRADDGVLRWQRPLWARAAAPALTPGAEPFAAGQCLLFDDGDALGDALADALADSGLTLIRVQAGAAFEQHHAGHYSIDPTRREDFRRLFFNLLTASGRVPELCLYLSASGDADAGPAGRPGSRGFADLLSLAAHWPALDVRRRLLLVSTGLAAVTGDEALDPDAAVVLGALEAIDGRHPDIDTCAIDLAPGADPVLLARALRAEALHDSAEPAVAYRNGRRWVRRFEPVLLPEPAADDGRGAARRVLIAGPFGERARVIAERLIETGVGLVLVDEAGAAAPDPLLDVPSLTLDPADPASVPRVVADVLARFGGLDGIIESPDRPPPDHPDADEAETGVETPAMRIATRRALIEALIARGQAPVVVLLHPMAKAPGTEPAGEATAASLALDAHACVYAEALAARGISAVAIGVEPGRARGTDILAEALATRLLGATAEPAEPMPRLLLAAGDLAARAEARRGAAWAPATEPDPADDDATAAERVAPRTDTERLIADIWQTLLGVAPIGAFDDFFRLGGHSLLATQALARLRGALHRELTLKTLFERPVLADLAAHLDAGDADQGAVDDRIPALPAGAERPLSFAQQRLWVLEQIEEQSVNYNIPAVVQIDGPLDEPALRRALVALVERHESLHVCFPMRDGRATLRVNPVYDPLETIDLSALDGDEQRRQVEQWTDRHAHILFDLGTGPLFRLRLLRLAADRHILLLNLHHIVGDGWSLGVLIRDWMRLYNAFASGAEPALPPLTIAYSDFAAWQRDWLSGERLADQRAYWLDQLAGMPELTRLPTDRPRPPVICYDGKSHQTTLPRALSRRIKALGEAQGATLFMTLLAALNLLLYRYSGQDDIAIGSPIANRTREQTEGLIGFFVNTLVLRSRLERTLTFAELLDQVKQTALAAYANQDVSFEYLVEQLNPVRSLSHTPLVQVILAVQNVPKEDLDLHGLEATFLDPGHRTVQFDLVLSAYEIDGLIACTWRYRSDLFDADTMVRIGGHFEQLLDGICTDPARPLGDYPLLDAGEQRLLARFSGRHCDAPLPRRTLIEQFRAQAAATPDAPAVVGQERALSYIELQRRARAVAGALSAAGVGPGVLTAICLERSVELIAALFGVLEAGGAYVPLDPTYPLERLRFMLEDSGASVLLTDRGVAPELAADPPAGVALLEMGALAGGTAASTPRAGLDDPIYAIYTSGSTGRPKAALCSQHGFVNLVEWYCDLLDLKPGVGLMLVSSFSFDLTQKNLFAPLIRGATLHLAPTGPFDPEAVNAAIARSGAVGINCTPTLFHALLDAAAGQGFAPLMSLRRVVLGGEPVDVARLRPWLDAAAAETRVVNSYGPTEATDVCCDYLLPPDCRPGDLVPIGRPLPHCRLYVLDDAGGQLPIGVPGELCVGGIGLGRGYINRPGLTAERFVEIGPEDRRERVYRTGDLARWRPDGLLDYHGRRDHQVKLRGFRVELGEIEAVLALDDEVDAAAARIIDIDGGQRLVAYAAGPGGDGTAARLRELARRRLPDYMVPSQVVMLDRMPLTGSGKIDRRALPDPHTPTATGEPPRTEAERRLAAIWSRLLKQERIGRDDNFFALGGDSILSIQLVAAARDAGLALTPRQVFEHQGLAEMAAVAGRAVASRAEQGPVAGTVPLTPIQRWLLDLDLPELHHYNQAVLRRVSADIDRRALRAAWAAVLAHHDTLRLRFARVGGVLQQAHVTLSDPALGFSHEDLGEVADPAAALYQVTAGHQASLDLARGPLARLVLLTWADQARLFLCIHHLVVDGVSWRFLLEDLERAYLRLSVGEPAGLPAKTTSFKDWSERLAAYAASDAGSADLGHWRGLAPIALPVDRPDGENRLEHQQELELTLDRLQTEALLKQVPAAYDTRINDVLLTALALTLADWTGRRDCLVDLEGHGRVPLFDDVDVSRTAGWFTTIFPVALRLPAESDPGAALLAVKQALAAVPNEGIGYGLHRYLRGEPLPGADILFNYFGQFDQETEAGLFGFADERIGPPVAPRGPRSHRLDIKAAITQGRFRLSWCFSRDCYDAGTIEGLAAGYRAHLSALIEHCAARVRRRRGLVTLHASEQPIREAVFALPGLMGRVGYLAPLARALSSGEAGSAVYGLEPPGLHGGERCEAIDALARHSLGTLRAVQPAGPYRLIGHSFGAAVALELAWQLEQAGETVALLAVLDQPAPADRREGLAGRWMERLVGIVGAGLGLAPPDRLRARLEAGESAAAERLLIDWLRREQILELLSAGAADGADAESWLAVFRANTRALDGYDGAGRRLRCPLTLIRAADGDLADSETGWACHTDAGVSAFTVPGGHLTMLRPPHVAAVAEVLRLVQSQMQGPAAE